MKRNKRKLKFLPSAIYCALLVLLLSLRGLGAAQQIAPVEAPEEITVTGERSTMQLRLQMLEAEEAAYAIFNQFNDEQRFDISCSIEARTGSRFERQICQPEFQIQAQRGHAQDFLDSMARTGMPDGSSVPTRVPMEAEISRQQAAFRRRMQQVAAEHPEFLDALMRYSASREQYEQALRAPRQ